VAAVRAVDAAPRILISVDFPAPFSPQIACTSPRAHSKLTSSSALTPGNVFTMSSIASECAGTISPRRGTRLLGRPAESVRAPGAGIAMKLAVLHDHGEAVRSDQDRQVGERIALDEEEIGERARLDHAKLAL